MHAADPQQSLTLTDLVTAWRRRWRTLAAGVVIGVTLAAATTVLRGDSFEAVTVVQVESTEPDLVDMAAEEAVATSRRVTAEALDALGQTSLTIEGLEAATAARVVASSHVLRITFLAATPRTAARGADDATAARPTGRVVDSARVPTAPRGPARGALLVAGGVIGLGVAAPVAARPATRSRAARAS